jgi:hypothetical protein
MLDLTFDVSIGGSSYNDYVVAIRRSHSICDGMGTGEIELAPGAALPSTYDSVVIYELGTKVFTGYVTNTKKGRMDVEYIVEIADPVIKLADYWTDTVYESSGETAEYWIGFFCDLVGVSYQFDVSYNRVVPDNSQGDGIEWQYSSALDIIRELIVVGGFYMWADADGLLHFSDINTGTNGNDSEILSIRRERSLDYARNRAIVFGKYPIAEEVTATVVSLDHEKTAIVASPYVETSEYALDLAGKMIGHFAQSSNIKFLEIIGIPSLQVGQQLHYADSWMGLDDYGLVTSFSSSMTNAGYIMDVVLDEFCPYIWGYARAAAVTIYAGTDGDGVWRSRNLGITWVDITNNIPSGVSHIVNGISASGQHVWAATEGGVYYTPSGEAVPASGVLWNDRTPTVPSGVTLTNWTDVEIDPADVNTVYVLMDDITNSGVYMHKTTDRGLTWDNTEVA